MSGNGVTRDKILAALLVLDNTAHRIVKAIDVYANSKGFDIAIACYLLYFECRRILKNKNAFNLINNNKFLFSR